MLTFTCRCGITFPTDESRLPIFCKCGAVCETSDSPFIRTNTQPRPRAMRKLVGDGCVFRGESIRLEKCQTCQGNVKVKVFACKVQNDCTLAKPIKGIACCATCPSEIRNQIIDRGTLGKIRVGFLAVAYLAVGGTETWHRVTLPRLSTVDVVGFVSTWKHGGDTSLLGCPAGHEIEAARELAKCVDVLVEWGVHDLASILPATNRPRVISVHHGDENSGWSKQTIDKRLEISEVIACVNPTVADQLQQRGVRAIYIPNAVVDGHLPRPDRIGQRRRVLWLARFSSEKRPLLAIEIAKLLPEVDFRFVGSGALLDAMQQAAEGLANVTIAAEVSEPWTDLAQADCFLSTSDQEGFGYSMAEAMLAEVPVVATPCGIASDPRICRQVSIDAPPDEWAATIRDVLAGDNIDRVTQAVQKVVTDYSPDKIVRQWEQLITAISDPSSDRTRRTSTVDPARA